MSDAIEKAWRELTAPQNETVTSKWYFRKGYEAALLDESSKNTRFVYSVHVAGPIDGHPACGSVAYGSSNYLIAKDETEVTCQRCIKKFNLRGEDK